MLSNDQMVMVKKAEESLYDAFCDVVVSQKKVGDNGAIMWEESTLHHHIPCRISFTKIMQTQPESQVFNVLQTIKLFLTNTIAIPEGSKVVVTQKNHTDTYQNSGQPAYYSTHQEIVLTTWKEWA